MSFKRYYAVNGQLLGQELANGSQRVDFLTDALGSVTATVDQTGTAQDSYRYTPYGQTLSTSGTGTVPDFRWVGTQGYRWCQGNNNSDYYVRARHYTSLQGRWTSVDPRWPSQSPYSYVKGSVTLWTDLTGEVPNGPLKCKNCYKEGDCDGVPNGCSDWAGTDVDGFADCNPNPMSGKMCIEICKDFVDPCIFDCVLAHEHQHVSDLGSCCAKIPACFQNTHHKPCCHDDFDNWEGQVDHQTECNAWVVTIQCLAHKLASLGCLSGDSANKCCKVVQQTFNDVQDTLFSYCGGQTSVKKITLPCGVRPGC